MVSRCWRSIGRLVMGLLVAATVVVVKVVLSVTVVQPCGPELLLSFSLQQAATQDSLEPALVRAVVLLPPSGLWQ